MAKACYLKKAERPWHIALIYIINNLVVRNLNAYVGKERIHCFSVVRPVAMTQMRLSRWSGATEIQNNSSLLVIRCTRRVILVERSWHIALIYIINQRSMAFLISSSKTLQNRQYGVTTDVAWISEPKTLTVIEVIEKISSRVKTHVICFKTRLSDGIRGKKERGKNVLRLSCNSLRNSQ